MKPVLSLLGRYALTLCLVAIAALVALPVWRRYEQMPWTRDGRVRADVVRIAPDVSGLVSEVLVQDNEEVHAGDVIFRIDHVRYTLALKTAEAKVDSSKAALDMANRDLVRYRQLNDTTVTRQKVEQVETAAGQAEATHRQAQLDRDLAALNLERSSVKAPVDGIVTNLGIHPGDFLATGTQAVALVDTASLRIEGYFEETKLRQVAIGDPARVRLMGDDAEITGRVESIAAAIADDQRSDAGNLLPKVVPTFSWVRLALRIPVRIHIDPVPIGIRLIAGSTATVEIVPATISARKSGSLFGKPDA
ncbi:HlyD family secretion protein [Rhizobium sp. 1399]|uniref:HlyD family secretion protein n=1 Tax=Rhizobium sp. 1399 TaxID=2817758 RepID=UPI0028558B08|nr:HlyD family secretion protein [Rhizobium sp. 1399]MDR6668457.1 multidrug resistance efflux pump [Rhizobium sp. 1399]